MNEDRPVLSAKEL